VNARIILIPTVSEQILDGSTDVIDPAKVKLPDTPIPLWRGNGYRVPEDLLGTVEKIWLEDGRILAEIVVVGFEPTWAGIRIDPDGLDLISAGLEKVQ
jgi:hypothetical protein